MHKVAFLFLTIIENFILSDAQALDEKRMRPEQTSMHFPSRGSVPDDPGNADAIHEGSPVFPRPVVGGAPDEKIFFMASGSFFMHSGQMPWVNSA